jgi:hypothetical protein
MPIILPILKQPESLNYRDRADIVLETRLNCVAERVIYGEYQLKDFPSIKKRRCASCQKK